MNPSLITLTHLNLYDQEAYICAFLIMQFAHELEFPKGKLVATYSISLLMEDSRLKFMS